MIKVFVETYDFAVIMSAGNRDFYENTLTGSRYLVWVAYESSALIHTYYPLHKNREHTFIAETDVPAGLTDRSCRISSDRR